MRIIIALLCLTPALAQAQLGLAFGLRDVNGQETPSANTDRRGYEFRVLYDKAVTPVLGWRADLAGVQMQFQKEIAPGDRRQISENGVELSFLIRAVVPSGALTGAYGLVGPVASWRVNCGLLGGFVDCDDTASQQFGYQLGAGYRSQLSARRNVFFEVKMVDGVVAGAGSPVFGLAIGLQMR